MVRRVSAGKLKLWQAARAELARQRGGIARLVAVMAVGLVFCNVPWWPSYERGLLTGVLLAMTGGVIAWSVWVTSGLAFRLNGVWAEEWTNGVLAKHASTLALLPSYKFSRFDIDVVLATRSAIYAVETKWTSSRLSQDDLVVLAGRLQRDVVKLRRVMVGQGTPESWIRGLLVVWGPNVRAIGSQLIDVGGGAQVRVVAGQLLTEWLDTQSAGKVGPDYAADLIRRLNVDNASIEDQIEAGRVMRWLARTR